MRKIKEQGGTSYKLFWADLGGKRKEGRVRRMKDDWKECWRRNTKCWK